MFKVGDKIRFAEEKRPYIVQARNDRFLICTKPFNLKHTVLYTIVDMVEGIRGADNYWKWGGYRSYQTRKECEEVLDALIQASDGVEISPRNQIKLNIL